jgi:hypothetical protein
MIDDFSDGYRPYQPFNRTAALRLNSNAAVPIFSVSGNRLSYTEKENGDAE